MKIEQIKTKLIAAPTVEPVTLAELEEHLRISSNSFADDLESVQSIPPADHATAAAYSLVGTGVDVLNYSALVEFSAGTCGSGGKIDVKVQESDDDITYTDWTGGAFPQVTEANDAATYEKEYTGIKQYIRVVSTITAAACGFGVNVLRNAPQSVEDAYLTGLIVTCRRIIETILNRRMVTQTWELALDSFPASDTMRISYPPLQTVSSVKYYDTDETVATFSDDFYHVDTYGEPGNVVLAYSQIWPTTVLRTVNGVITQYICGYGDAATDVPDEYRQAVKIFAGELYEHREATDPRYITSFSQLPYNVQMILGFDRIVPI